MSSRACVAEGEESGGDGGVRPQGPVPEGEGLPDDGGSAKRRGRSLSQSWDGALGGNLLASKRRSSKRRETGVRTQGPRGPPGPFYYVGGANGAKIVSRYCEDQGWQRIHDQHRTDYRLKWCETKSRDSYQHFREGHQLLFQIPNNAVLTTKIGLLSSLREYERVSSKVNNQGIRRLKMEQFFPDTYRLDLRKEREAFFAQQNGVEEGEPGSSVWICKPTGMNQGRGIFLLKTPEDVAGLRLRLQQQQERCQGGPQGRPRLRPPQAHVAQRYVTNPLLLEGRKFDVRSFLLIACTDPYMVFFRHGYARLTCDPYDPGSSDLSSHLTNQFMQKKNPLYSELKEDTVWSMEKLNDYVNDTYSVAKALPRDWITGDFARTMQQIMFQCFLAVKSKLDRKLGLFDLLGCDFLIDEDFKVWLLEMNCNPALHTNCGVLQDVVPSMLVETLDITCEIFSKRLCGQPVLPLLSQKDFVLLYSSPAPLAQVLLPVGRRGTAGAVQPRSTPKQNARTSIPNIKRPGPPAALRRCSVGGTNRTSHVSGTQSEEVCTRDAFPSQRIPETSSPSSTSPLIPAAGDTHRQPPSDETTATPCGTEAPSTHVSGLPLKSSHSRAELRLSTCSWPPPDQFISAKNHGGRRATVTSLQTARAPSKRSGGSQEAGPGGARPMTTLSPHPGRPARTGSQEKGEEAREAGSCLPDGNKKGEVRYRICK